MENWDKLDFERHIIEGTEDMTFDEAKVRVNAALKKLQEKMYMKQSRDFIEEENVKNSNDTIIMDSIATNFQSTAIQQKPYNNANYNKKITTNQPNIRCYNCGLTTHNMYQCNEPWCSKCKHTWKSTNDTRYHRMNQCNLPQEAKESVATMQGGTKRPYEQNAATSSQPVLKKKFIENKPRSFFEYKTRQQFPPRGTAQTNMKANASIEDTKEDNYVDYDDIESLRAFASRMQNRDTEQEDPQEYQQITNSNNENEQDADWDPEYYS